MTKGSARVSIVIVSWNSREFLRDCLRSVYAARDCSGTEVIVVDNGSSDGSVEMVEREFPDASMIPAGENLGFGRASNLGASKAAGDLLFLLNSDAEVGD